jgi:uracil phosphoribosyltransferase
MFILKMIITAHMFCTFLLFFVMINGTKFIVLGAAMDNLFVSNHPLVKHKLTKLRDKNTDPKKFRELIREIAGLLAYEVTADLMISPIEVETPMATANGFELQEKIGLIPILRSGLGMVEGV